MLPQGVGPPAVIRGGEHIRSKRTGTVLITAVLTTGFVAAAGSTAATAAPPKVRVVPVATLANPVGFTFTPDGRIVYAERDTGEVRFLNPRTGSDHLFFRIGGVNSEGERGALGVALHPDWPRTPFVYIYVTRGPGSRPLRTRLPSSG